MLLALAACGGDATGPEPAAPDEAGSAQRALPTPQQAAHEASLPADWTSHRAGFQAVANTLAASKNQYVGFGQLDELRQSLARQDLPDQARVSLGSRYAMELLRCGMVEDAVAQIISTRQLTESLNAPAQVMLPVLQLEGIIHLRQAEVENCIRLHDAECCILPLQGGGQHTVQGPAVRALAAFEACLAIDPRQLDVRWLFNLSAMALGRYPDAIPEPVRIPPTVFASDEDFPRFPDVAGDADVDTFNHCGGVAVEDFDGDGLLDIVTSTFDLAGPMHAYRGLGGLRFEDNSRRSLLDDQLGGLNCIAVDYDNDGDPDVLVLRGAWLFDDGRIRNSLLRNDEGRFTDVTSDVGLAFPTAPTQAACWGDFDDDGRLDLYIGNESRLDRGETSFPSQLFVADADGRFSDRAPELGVTNDRYAKGVAAGDYDNDGDLDLYVSNVGENRLYRNDDGAGFTDVSAELGVQDPDGRSFACWFFDVQNDGWLDLFVGAFDAQLADVAADALGLPHGASAPRLYRNDGGQFTDVATDMGLDHAWLPMGANFGDLDHDGFLDIYLATGDPGYQTLTPNVMLRNDGGARFLDVTTAGGFGHVQKGHGVAFADLDEDGDQDIYNQLGGFYPGDAYRNALFENPGNDHHVLYVRLEGSTSNRPGYGARVRVVVEDADGARREIHRAMGSVSSFGGSPARLEIGLGDAVALISLQVRWPTSGLEQTFTDVEWDQLILVREGDPQLIRRPLAGRP